jgi:hypothetical protein
MDNETKIVVSVTTIPPRFNDLGLTLKSILDQSRRPDSIEVTVPRSYRRFPQHEFRSPEVPDGVEIVVTDEDLGPASKVLPCARRYRGQNVRIVYCDDDRAAPRDWLESLLSKTREHPEKAIVASGGSLDRLLGRQLASPEPRAVRQPHRTNLLYRLERIEQGMKNLLTGQRLPKPARRLYRKDGYVHIACGLGGVSVAPDFFDDESYTIPNVIWAVDDIWLSGSLERRGIRIWADSNCRVPVEHQGGNYDALFKSIIEDADRHEANAACVRYMQEKYGIWS